MQIWLCLDKAVDEQMLLFLVYNVKCRATTMLWQDAQ